MAPILDCARKLACLIAAFAAFAAITGCSFNATLDIRIDPFTVSTLPSPQPPAQP